MRSTSFIILKFLDIHALATLPLPAYDDCPVTASKAADTERILYSHERASRCGRAG